MRTGFMGHISVGGFGGAPSGRFVAAGSGPAGGDLITSGDGTAWGRPSTLPAGCGVAAVGLAFGRGVVVLGHESGTICRSSDGGANWVTTAVDAALEGDVVWTGSEFVAWGVRSRVRVRLRSADGATWTSEPTSLRNADGTMAAGPVLGAVGFDATTGTLVAVKGGNQQWYDRQAFYRSVDGGRTWTALPATSFHASHRISSFAVGDAAPGACP
jgi:hypothetical protein